MGSRLGLEKTKTGPRGTGRRAGRASVGAGFRSRGSRVRGRRAGRREAGPRRSVSADRARSLGVGSLGSGWAPASGAGSACPSPEASSSPASSSATCSWTACSSPTGSWSARSWPGGSRSADLAGTAPFSPGSAARAGGRFAPPERRLWRSSPARRPRTAGLAGKGSAARARSVAASAGVAPGVGTATAGWPGRVAGVQEVQPGPGGEHRRRRIPVGQSRLGQFRRGRFRRGQLPLGPGRAGSGCPAGPVSAAALLVTTSAAALPASAATASAAAARARRNCRSIDRSRLNASSRRAHGRTATVAAAGLRGMCVPVAWAASAAATTTSRASSAQPGVGALPPAGRAQRHHRRAGHHQHRVEDHREDPGHVGRHPGGQRDLVDPAVREHERGRSQHDDPHDRGYERDQAERGVGVTPPGAVRSGIVVHRAYFVLPAVLLCESRPTAKGPGIGARPAPDRRMAANGAHGQGCRKRAARPSARDLSRLRPESATCDARALDTLCSNPCS